MTNIFKKSIVATVASFAVLTTTLLGSLKTPIERTDFQTWSTHLSVVSFLDDLEAESPLISKHSLGTSEQGREIFYLKVTTDETFGQNQEKLRVLIFGQQHGNEPSGNEAILELLRNFAIGESLDWLQKMDLLFVPQVNPDGAEVHKRRNADNIDLNRSHLILDGKEVRHLRDLFHKWEPEVTLDIHEYQPWARSWMSHGYIRPFDVQFGLPTNLNVPEAIRNLAENKFLQSIDAYLDQRGFSHHNYLVGNPDSIRYSTSNINDGRQSMAILGTFSLILEGRRDRDNFGNIAGRTAAQTAAIEGLLQFVFDHAEEVRKTVHSSRQNIKNGEIKDFILTMGRKKSGDPLRIPAYELSENENGEFEEGDLIEVEIKNYFPIVTAESMTSLPKGYIVPADAKEIIRLLRQHQVELSELTGSEEFQVEQFRIDGFKEEYFESAMTIPTGSFSSKTYFAKAGDLFVPTAQLRGLMVATALEPQSMHGWIQYESFGHLKQPGDFPILRVLPDP